MRASSFTPALVILAIEQRDDNLRAAKSVHVSLENLVGPA